VAEQDGVAQPERVHELGEPAHVGIVGVVGLAGRLVRPAEPDKVRDDDAQPGVCEDGDRAPEHE
jgi:hypothetical protein